MNLEMNPNNSGQEGQEGHILNKVFLKNPLWRTLSNTCPLYPLYPLPFNDNNITLLLSNKK